MDRPPNALLVGSVAGVISIALWIVTLASAPRHSVGPQTAADQRATVFMVAVLVAAFVGGFLVPKRAPLIGLMLVLPGFVMSPWTAPRGDGDGLWVLIPMLAVFALVAVASAALGAWVHKRVGERSRRPEHT